MLQPIIGGKYVEKSYNHVKYIERVVQPIIIFVVKSSFFFHESQIHNISLS